MRFVIGLGNPGAQYEWTRHNLGFMLIDMLAREEGAQVKRRDCRAFIGRAVIENETVELVKPQTFMNLSGETIACLLAKEESKRRALQNLIVISDDLALPFGTLRLRAHGTAGGHNGLKSIIAALGTNEFARLRIGIGTDHPVTDTARFVLDEFSRHERDKLQEILEQGGQAIRAVIRDGIDKAMAQHN